MPRYVEPESATPFGKVLVDFMWSRRPPLGPVQLAVRLGIPKQSVTNWIMRGSSPSLETMLYVLAKLDIPLRTLYDAYRDAGLSVPRFDTSSAEPPIVTDKGDTSQRKETRVPVDLDSPRYREQGRIQAPQPRPYTPPPPIDPTEQEAAEWDKMIAQTTAALRAEGMPQDSIAAVIASLRARQSGGATTTERHTHAEHTEDPPTSAGSPGSAESAGEPSPRRKRDGAPSTPK